MILNIPTRVAFEEVAKENLTQGFHLLYQVYQNYINHDDEVIKEEVSIDEIWNHHSGTIRTSLILLHQAIEGLMKAIICETSPLLLIDKPRKDWPTLPDAEDKDFDSLYTIGGEALLKTFCVADSQIIINSVLIDFIEEIRQIRNRAIHGTNITGVTPSFIIGSILNTFTIWFGKDSWLLELKDNLVQNPLFGYIDHEFETASSYGFLDFSMFILGKNDLSKHISLDINARPYFCPECKKNIEHKYGYLESKWAFLSPNEPKSTKIACVNCSQTFDVKRQKCMKNGCKGNVLYDDPDYYDTLLCLTCFESLTIPETDNP